MTCYPWRERRGNERNDQTSLAPACLFPSVRLIMDGPFSIAIARHLLQQTVCGIRTWFDEVLGICFDPEEGRLKAWWRLGLPNSAWLWGGEPRWAMTEDNQGLIVSWIWSSIFFLFHACLFQLELCYRTECCRLLSLRVTNICIHYVHYAL